MAHEVVVTTQLDGSRRTILHVTLRSDGASGDISNYEIADPGDDYVFVLEKIQSSFVGFSGSLKFEYLINGTFVWPIPEFDSVQDFRPEGGLMDRSNVLDGTGKVLLSTEGFGDDDVGSFTITLRKKQK